MIGLGVAVCLLAEDVGLFLLMLWTMCSSFDVQSGNILSYFILIVSS